MVELRVERAQDRAIYCGQACYQVARKRVCEVEGCEKQQRSTAGYCALHYSRYRRHGDPMVKVYRRGADDGVTYLPVKSRVLSPAQISILVELADGQPRSLGLLADVTSYAMSTVREEVYRLRRKYGARVIEITHSQRRKVAGGEAYNPRMAFRLTETISL